MLDRKFAVRYTPVNLEPGNIGDHIERTDCTDCTVRPFRG